jgi:hypothetical protein
LLVLVGAFAQAQLVPSNISSGRNGLAIQALGNTCFSFNVGADTLPCNPAFMAFQQDQNFKANLFGGNNIAHLGDAIALVQGNGQQSNVQNLFSSRNNSEFDASVEGAYLNHNFGLAYEPFRINYFSIFRDPALPQITLFASLENSVRMQLASFTSNDFSVGLQIRYLDRQIIASQFFLTDLMAENGTTLLNSQEQQYYFLEPGVLYAPKNEDWRPQVSFSLINWGLHVDGNAMTDPIPEAHLGFSVSPTVGWGRWGWAIDSSWNQSNVNAIDAFTLGTYYQMGILKAFGSLSTTSSGLGFSVLYDHFNLGISYTSTLESLDADTSVLSQRVYFMLGGEM